MSKNMTPIDVTAVEPEVLYTARLEFRSKGSGDNVMPHAEYSHHFPDDYEGPFPAAFLAMRDLTLMLSSTVEMIPNTEYENLPDDPDERAELAIAMADAQAHEGETN